MAGCWKLYYASWSSCLFNILVHEIRQQLTPKMWEKFTDLFAYKFDYVSVILLTLFFLPAWLCVQMLYMSEDEKKKTIIFSMTISLWAPLKIWFLFQEHHTVGLIWLLNPHVYERHHIASSPICFQKLFVLHENFLLSHTPMSSNVRISFLGNHLKGSQNSVLLWRSIQILYRIPTLNIWKAPCVCVCVCLCLCNFSLVL